MSPLPTPGTFVIRYTIGESHILVFKLSLRWPEPSHIAFR